MKMDNLIDRPPAGTVKGAFELLQQSPEVMAYSGRTLNKNLTSSDESLVDGISHKDGVTNRLNTERD
jgi:hypothetical protein